MSPSERASLVESVLDSHGTHEDGSWELLPDHVVFDEAAGAFATWVSADELGRPVDRVVGLVVADGRGPTDAGLSGVGARVLELRARRAGFHFAPRGLGRCDHVYLDRLAAPGRLALTAGGGATVAGAVGTLVLGVSALEGVVASIGAPVAIAVPPVMAIELHGALGTGVGGHDLMVEIAHRGADRIPTGSILEFSGPGFGRLSMHHRLTAAMNIEGAGAGAVLMPVDDAARSWFAAHGRESDWKRFAASETGEPGALIQLETIEPWLYRSGEPSERRRVRHAAGSRIEAVVIGPGAGEADLEWMLARLVDRTISSDTRCFLVPGSRRVLDAARRDPARRILNAAGVRWSASPALPGGRGMTRGRVLYYGVPPVDRLPHGDVAGLETCVASACAGYLVDPRELPPVEVATTPGGEATRIAGVLPPEPWSGGARHVRPVQPPRRLMVAARFGDDLTTNDVVAWGPRALLLDPDVLAQRTLAGRDVGLAARMAVSSGVCIVARRQALAGPRCEIAAWVLARAGVRIVAAQSFAPGVSRHLAAAGVLALEWPRDGRCQLEPGDEIELAGGPETRAGGVFVTIRNLARGSQELHRHDLDARWAAVLRAGGLIRHVDTVELVREVH